MTKKFMRHMAILLNGLFILSLLIVNIETMSAERLIHNVEHEQHLGHEQQTVHLSSYYQKAIDFGDEGHSFSVNEHLLLHSMDQLQYFSYPLLVENLIAVLPNAAPLKLAVQAVPLTSFDPPFRPPRSLS